MITETWLDKKIEDAEVDIPGYKKVCIQDGGETWLDKKIEDAEVDIPGYKKVCIQDGGVGGNCRCLAETCSCTLCSLFIYSISASSAR